MNQTNPFRADLEALIQSAYNASMDIGREVDAILREGMDKPLGMTESVELLGRVVRRIKEAAAARGDTSTAAKLEGEVEAVVARIILSRSRAPATLIPSDRMALQEANGIKIRHVVPRPTFHGKEIPVTEGGISTTDIRLWDHNERLEIHLAQFQEKEGRRPNRQELLDIMLGKMPLPGVEKEDEFEIVELANSISVNGVRKPPIIDQEGNLLDGNRRVTACYYILNSDEYTAEQKKRAGFICVWQLSEHATLDEKASVVVSLNFESDCKVPWPEYVKARKISDEWKAMLALEQRDPAADRQRVLKQQLSQKFALGRDLGPVNRYLRMIQVAEEFEEHHTNTNKREEFEVRHRARETFQYFDELSKGADSGVAFTLRQNPELNKIVLDLLYQGKFRNWAVVRGLRNYTKDVHDALVQARDLPDVEDAQTIVEDSLAMARAQRRETRIFNANDRIESFVEFLENLPISAFRDVITKENLARLVRALELVNTQAKVQAELPFE